MNEPGTYHCLDADVKPGEVGYDDNGILCQLVSVIMTDDRCFLEPAIGLITAEEARELAFELLACAEHAERLTQARKDRR